MPQGQPADVSIQRFWIDLPQSPPGGEQASGEALEPLLYEVKWHRQDLSLSPEREPQSYLLVAQDSALAGHVHEALRSHGLSGNVVEASDSSAIAQALHECLVRSSATPMQVIYLGGTTAAEPLCTANLRKIEDLSWRPLLDLMQSLATTGDGRNARLWVVTRGLHAAEPGERCVRPEGAVLWGLGKVYGLEHPDLWGGLVDMPAIASAADAQQLLAEVSAQTGEDHVALRQGRRYVARVERLAQSLPDRKWPVDGAGVYWITGGLGAVGLQIADWLARRGARHLVLQGRTGLPDRAAWPAALASGDAEVRQRIESVRRLESLGAAVHILAADVAAAGFLPQAAALLEGIAQPLKAVFHAAGVSGLQTIAEMTPEHLHRVLAAKVEGTWNLHELASRWPSATLVGFSSIASVWGSRSLAHYAAGNAFLDAFIHYRHGLGLPGLSVNFGPIAGGGMDLAREEQRLRRIGIRTLSASQVSATLDRMLSGSVAQITAVDVDWSMFKPVYEAQRSRPLLSLLGEPVDAAAAGEAPHRTPLVSAAPGERTALVEEYLLEQAAAVLQADISQLDPAEPLISLGVDSLMAMELQKRVRTHLGAELPVAAFLQGITVRQLAQRIASGLDAGRAEASQPDPSETVEGEL
jgi:aryl carrier-like protein/NADP-dependent 3-hydroxy acid dehydrogenase YdfG